MALDSDLWLRAAIVATMVGVFVAVSAVVLWMLIYLTIKNPGYLFSPGEVAKLSESVQKDVYSIPTGHVSLESEDLSVSRRSAGGSGSSSTENRSDKSD